MSHRDTWARRALLTATTSSLALVASPALGQGQEGVAVETVVVTAQRRVEENIKVPVAITAVGAAEIQNITAGFMTDIGIKVPNVFMSQGSISPSISIRGVSSQSNINAGFPPAVGVYVDEVYQGRDPTFNTILNDVERVEVLRGPQGTLYGKNTIGGAINIITTEPMAELSASGDVQFGNLDLVQLRASIGGPIIGDRLMLRFSAVHRQRDGFLKNTTTGDTLGDLDSDGFRLVVVSNLTDTLRLRVSGDYFKETGTSALETGPVVFPAPVPAVLAAIPPQDETDNIVQLNFPETAARELHGFAVRLDQELGFADLTSITAYRRYESAFLDDSDGLPIDAFDVGRDENAENFSQEFRLTSTGEGPVTWILGLYYYRENIENIRRIHLGSQMPILLTGGSIPGFTGERAQTYSTIVAKSYAAFGSATWQITEQLRLSGGLRYTHEKKDFFYRQFFTQTFANIPASLLIRNFAVAIPATREDYSDGRVTGDVSLSFDFSEDATGYAKYSRGFKAGGFQTDVISPPFIATDPLGFAPETVNNYELGFKSYWFDRRVSLNLAAFYLDWKDKQEQIFTGLSFLIRNAATASSRGLEIELTARPTRYLTLDANGAYLKAKYDSFPTQPALSGRQFQGTPNYSGSVGAQYVYPMGNGMEVFARGDVIYRGETYVLNNATTQLNNKSLTTLNVRVGVQAEDGDWGVYAWSKNLTDVVRVGGGSSFPFPRANITTRGPGFGRTYGVELRARY